MMNKKGDVGMSIITMYRVFVVIIVAIIILGASAIVYSHHINIRDSEAMIMVREISGCVISDAVVNLTKLKAVDNVFEYCGFEDNEVENFFVSVSVSVVGGEDFRIEGGDSGLLWVRDVYSGGADVIDRYEPGHFKRDFNVIVFDEGIERDGSVSVEVVVNAE